MFDYASLPSMDKGILMIKMSRVSWMNEILLDELMYTESPE